MNYKKIIKAYILSRIIWLYYFILSKTLKVVWIDYHNYQKTLNTGGVICFWHEHLASVLTALRLEQKKVYSMVSPSHDGKIVAFIIRKLKHHVIEGSSFKNPTQATKEVIRLLKDNQHICLAVDGPRGPRRQSADGAVFVARITHQPIIPICAIASRYWLFRSTWDQTKFPKFFAKIYIICGEPVILDRTTDFDINSTLNTLEDKLMKTLDHESS